MMNNFKKINVIAGWIIGIIASTVYILTIEPTASFWDCGEFIATALKLEVGHPPGAPLFMLLGRVATLFAGSSVTAIPITINIYSALCSGFTILFLFWSITHLARKIVGNKTEYTLAEVISIIGSGVVGALAYTFSDSFWFSAVEGEVYASSSFYTAIVFWVILKWENEANEKYANRWIILIAYLMGLSIGVHLLNLLAIPAIVMIYYFKKYTVTRNGVIIALLSGIFILGVIMYGVIQGTFTVATWFELFFVNVLSFPFSSGFAIYLILLIGAVIFGLWYTAKKGKVMWNTILLALAVILLGYSSYATILIRSYANTPLNENNPSNLFNLLSYLNREQYGDRPLLYGPYYNAPVKEVKEGSPVYIQDVKTGKYKEIYHRPEYVYDPAFCTIFPRMYSREHAKNYQEWANIKGTKIQSTNEQGEPTTLIKPTFVENLTFFFKYQIGYMYFRYFMWNFSGRQNDIQGHGGILKGNWITGINFIDEFRLGPQDKLPASLKDNQARNKYYMLPFILGLIGLMFHYQKNQKDFWVVSLLFFMTGIAILLYLNQKPMEPRERDYAYAGSFYAYAIWIGLGVMALIDMLKKRMNGVVAGILITIFTLGLVPGIMANQNWDDHDRSHRYTCRDFAYDYLNSCEPNAILFTNGDNDTFPLWYAQEVENIRTDVRVVNLSYLGADWYIEQMQRKVYESEALPLTMKKEKYQTGSRDVLYIVDRVNNYADLKDVMDFVASDSIITKTLPNYRERIEYLPAKKFSIKVDSSVVMANHVVAPKLAKLIVPEMKWELKKRTSIYKNDLMVLDMMAHNNWKRPMYFAITVSDENYLGLEKYFQLQGLAYKIVPIESTERNDFQNGSIDTEILYNNLINKFVWGGIANPKVYLDENNMRMLSNFRNNFARLAEALVKENKIDSAKVVLNKCLEVMPIDRIPLNYWALPLVEQFYNVKLIDKANTLVDKLLTTTDEELKYYFRLRGKFAEGIDYEKRVNMQVLNELVRITDANGQTPLKDKINTVFQGYMRSFAPTQQ